MVGVGCEEWHEITSPVSGWQIPGSCHVIIFPSQVDRRRGPHTPGNHLDVNVDLIINTPCRRTHHTSLHQHSLAYLAVLQTVFDIGQATPLW